MRRIGARWISMFAAVALLAGGFTVANASPASAANEDTILSLVNQAREAEGLGPLTLNAAMSAVSTAWANQMATNGEMTHNPNFSKQIPQGWVVAGENVATGYSSPTAVHNAWMGSPGHRANILGNYTDIGIAFITVGGKTWAVENFARYGSASQQPTPLPAGVERLSGNDRYSTAVAISKEYDPGVNAVYLATGTNYPDALSAAPAAAKQGGPLLLTPPTGLLATVRAEIQRLKPTLIVVVGGAGVISDSIFKELSFLAPSIRRDGGVDRYETSRTVVDRAFTAGTTSAYFATGQNFPDALSASAAAGSTQSPVFLVDGLAGKVDAATAALMRKLGVTSGIIAGGTGVVSMGMEASLRAQPGMKSVVRYAGSDRYSTSREINRNSFTSSPQAFFAVGTGFADALAGAALAGRDGAPLHVVPGNCVPRDVVNDLAQSGTTKRTLLGGAGALSSRVASLSPCAQTR